MDVVILARVRASTTSALVVTCAPMNPLVQTKRAWIPHKKREQATAARHINVMMVRK